MKEINTINDAKKFNYLSLYNNEDDEVNYLEQIKIESIDMQRGIVKIKYNLFEKYYYDMISKLTGVDIELVLNGEYRGLYLATEMIMVMVWLRQIFKKLL